MSIKDLNRFVYAPGTIDIGRSKFPMNHGAKMTFKLGELVPIDIIEVLPGDTFEIDLSAVIRTVTPVVPVMDNMYMDVYSFFVPNRLCTQKPDDWQKICGENVTTPWANNTEYELLNTGNSVLLNKNYQAPYFSIGSLLTYFGFPTTGQTFVNIDFSNSPIIYNLMPINGYRRIWNEFFRDQNTQNPVLFVTEQDFENPSEPSGNLDSLLKVNKFHDYFTSALPSPQKGDSVLIPLLGNAPITSDEAFLQTSLSNIASGAFPTGGTPLRVHMSDNDITPASTSIALMADNGTSGMYNAYSNDNPSASSSNVYINGTNIALSKAEIEKMYADLSQVSGATINQLRLSFAIQRALEKDARGGTRYNEMLLNHFGTSVRDDTLQRAQYISGTRFPLNITQVLQTSSTDQTSPLGSTGAFSNTGVSGKMVLPLKSFNEFGYIYILACVRCEQSYAQGLSKLYTRNKRFDFYYPVFANIGEQPILNRELFVYDDNKRNDVFGYQEAWAEYRYIPNRVLGGFSPDSGENSLIPWSYVNDFDNTPALASFMPENPHNFWKTLVSDNYNYDFIADFYFKTTAVRPMPVYSIPGLIDHH